MKIRFDKKRGHVSGKGGDNASKLSPTLPLKGRILYLDLQGYRAQKSLEEDLRTLGAIIERCFSKDVTCMITNKGSVADYVSSRTEPKKDRDLHDPTSPATPSPFSVQVDSPQAHSPGNLSGDPKQPPMTRGQKLAQAARHKKCDGSTDIVEVAKKWRIKVVHIDVALKWVKRELDKLPLSLRTSNAKVQAPKKHQKVKRLKSPCLKFEASNRHYRPVRQEFAEFPQVYLTSAPVSCPFELSKRIQRGDANDAERAEGEERDPRPQEVVSDAKESIESKAATPSVKNSVSLKPLQTPSSEVPFGKIYTAGELRRKVREQRQMEQKKGYCELCNIKYDNIDKHVISEQHKKFVRNAENYSKLDSMIGTSNMEIFLQNIANSNPLAMQDYSSDDSDDVLLLSENSTPRTPRGEKFPHGTGPRRSPRKKTQESRPADVHTHAKVVLSPLRKLPSPVKTPKKQLSCLAMRQSPILKQKSSPGHGLFESPKKKAGKSASNKQSAKSPRESRLLKKKGETSIDSVEIPEQIRTTSGQEAQISPDKAFTVVVSPVKTGDKKKHLTVVVPPGKTVHKVESPKKEKCKLEVLPAKAGRLKSMNTTDEASQMSGRISTRLTSPLKESPSKSNRRRSPLKPCQSSMNSNDVSGILSPRRSLQSQLQEAELDGTKNTTRDVSMETYSRASPGVGHNTQTDSIVFSSQDATLNSTILDGTQGEIKDASQDGADSKLYIMPERDANEKPCNLRHSTPKPESHLAHIRDRENVDEVEENQPRRTRSRAGDRDDSGTDAGGRKDKVNVVRSSKFWEYVVEELSDGGGDPEEEETGDHIADAEKSDTENMKVTGDGVTSVEHDLVKSRLSKAKRKNGQKSSSQQSNSEVAQETSHSAVNAVKSAVKVDTNHFEETREENADSDSSKRVTRRSGLPAIDGTGRTTRKETGSVKAAPHSNRQISETISNPVGDISETDSVVVLKSHPPSVDDEEASSTKVKEKKAVKRFKYWQYVEEPVSGGCDSNEDQPEILESRTRRAQSFSKKNPDTINATSHSDKQISNSSNSRKVGEIAQPNHVSSLPGQPSVGNKETTSTKVEEKKVVKQSKYWQYVQEPVSDSCDSNDDQPEILVNRTRNAQNKKAEDDLSTSGRSKVDARRNVVAGSVERKREGKEEKLSCNDAKVQEEKSSGNRSRGQARFWHYVVESESEEVESGEEVILNLNRSERAARRTSQPINLRESRPEPTTDKPERKSRSAPSAQPTAQQEKSADADRERGTEQRAQDRAMSKHHRSSSRFWEYVVESGSECPDSDDIDINIPRSARAARRGSNPVVVTDDEQQASRFGGQTESTRKPAVLSPRSNRLRRDPHYLPQARYKHAFQKEQPSSELDVSTGVKNTVVANSSLYEDEALDASLIALLLEEDLLLAGRRKTRGISGTDDVSRERVLREILQKQEATLAQLKEESFTASLPNSPKCVSRTRTGAATCNSPPSSVCGIQGSERSPKLGSRLSPAEDQKESQSHPRPSENDLRTHAKKQTRRKESPEGRSRKGSLSGSVRSSRSTTRMDEQPNDGRDGSDSRSNSRKRASRFWTYVEEKDDNDNDNDSNIEPEMDEKLLNQPRRLRNRDAQKTADQEPDERVSSRSRSRHTPVIDHTDVRNRRSKSSVDVTPGTSFSEMDNSARKTSKSVEDVSECVSDSDRKNDRHGTKQSNGTTDDTAKTKSRQGSRFWTYVVETGDEGDSEEESEVEFSSRLRSRDKAHHEKTVDDHGNQETQSAKVPQNQKDADEMKSIRNKAKCIGNVPRMKHSSGKRALESPEKNTYSPKRLRTRHDKRERRVVHIDRRPNASQEHTSGQIVKSSKFWTIVRYPVEGVAEIDERKVVRLRRRSKQSKKSSDGDSPHAVKKGEANDTQSDADDEAENEHAPIRKQSHRFWEYLPRTPEGAAMSAQEDIDHVVRPRRKAAQVVLQNLVCSESVNEAEPTKQTTADQPENGERGVKSVQENNSQYETASDNERRFQKQNAKPRRRQVFWTYEPVSEGEDDPTEGTVAVTPTRRLRSGVIVSGTDNSDTEAANSRKYNQRLRLSSTGYQEKGTSDSGAEKETREQRVTTDANSKCSGPVTSRSKPYPQQGEREKQARFWTYVPVSTEVEKTEEQVDIVESGKPRRARLNVSYKEVEEFGDDDVMSKISWNTHSSSSTENGKTKGCQGKADQEKQSQSSERSRQKSVSNKEARKNKKWQYVAFRNQAKSYDVSSENYNAMNGAVQLRIAPTVQTDHTKDSPQSSVDCGLGEKIVKQSRFWTIAKRTPEKYNHCGVSRSAGQQKGPTILEPSQDKTLTNLTNIQPRDTHQSKKHLKKRRVKLAHNWSLVSDHSMQKLLASEEEDENFEGFGQDDKDGASNLSFEDVSEVEVDENSDVEWVIDDSKRVRKTIEIGSDALELDVDTAGSSEASWDDNLLEFVDNKVAEKKDPSSRDEPSRSVRPPILGDSMQFSPSFSLFNISMDDVEDLWTGPVRNDKTKWLKEGKIYKPSTPMLSERVSQSKETPRSYLRSPSVAVSSTALNSPAPMHSSTPVRPKPKSKLQLPASVAKSSVLTAVTSVNNSALIGSKTTGSEEGAVSQTIRSCKEVSSPRKKKARTVEDHNIPKTPTSQSEGRFSQENQSTGVNETPPTASNQAKKLLKSCSNSKKSYKLTYVPSASQNISISGSKSDKVSVSRNACLSPLGPALMSPPPVKRLVECKPHWTPKSDMSPTRHLHAGSPIKSALPLWMQGEVRRSPRKLLPGSSPDSASNLKSPSNQKFGSPVCSGSARRVGFTSLIDSDGEDFVRSPSRKRAHPNQQSQSRKKQRHSASPANNSTQTFGSPGHRTDDRRSHSKSPHSTSQSSSSKSKSPNLHHTKPKSSSSTPIVSAREQSPRTPVKEFRSPVRSSPRKVSNLLVRSTYEFDG